MNAETNKPREQIRDPETQFTLYGNHIYRVNNQRTESMMMENYNPHKCV